MFKVKVKNTKNNASYESEPLPDKTAKEWLAARLISGVWGSFADLEIETIDLTLELAQKSANDQALNYLASTDWYVIRKMDTGIAVPEEIEKLRQDARERIVRS